MTALEIASLLEFDPRDTDDIAAAAMLRKQAAAIKQLREDVNAIHHAMQAAGWHPGRTDDLLTDIIKAKGAEMARLERENAALEAALKPEQSESVADKLNSEWTPCVKLPITVHVRNQREGEKHISTREGITPVKPDDLIMRGVAGEEYPIGRELFERTYRIGATPPAPQYINRAEADSHHYLSQPVTVINRPQTPVPPRLTEQELANLFGGYGGMTSYALIDMRTLETAVRKQFLGDRDE